MHTPQTGKHQDQVKVLIESTASSLDDAALKMLFVSVQQNNIELCIQHATERYVVFSDCWWDLTMAFFRLTKQIGDISTVCPRHRNPNDCKAEFDSGRFDVEYNDVVWAFICEWTFKSLYWVFTLYGIVTCECCHTICKYMSSLKFVNGWCLFQKSVSGSWGEKGLCETNYILTCAVWDWLWFRMWAQYLVE